MNHDHDALRQLNEEAQIRISELSTALERVTEQRDNLEDAANSLNEELDFARKQISALQATVQRLKLHLQQGVEL